MFNKVVVEILRAAYRLISQVTQIFRNRLHPSANDVSVSDNCALNRRMTMFVGISIQVTSPPWDPVAGKKAKVVSSSSRHPS